MNMLVKSDSDLVQIVDAATADAARRSGTWLKCRPGCTQCCIGVFAISQLDAFRLREGLENLELSDPARAAAVRLRVEASVRQLSTDFPGDPATGILHVASEDSFADFANDEPCPVLDPSTGTCDLYASRPMTCRVFGPPVRTDDGIGICELCFNGASEEEILAGELSTEWSRQEDLLNAEVEARTGRVGSTIIAYALNPGS
jgi:Fe-S-cluster containining protein